MNAGSWPWLVFAGGRVRAAVAAGVALVICGAGLAAAAPAGAAASPPLLAGSPLSASARAGDPIENPPADLQTRVVTHEPAEPGDNYEVTVGPTSYTAPALNSSCGVGVWVLALDRAHLSPLHPPTPFSQDFPLCTNGDAAQLGQWFNTLGSSRLVIVNSLNHGGTHVGSLSGLGPAMAGIGALAPEFGFDLDTTGFSVMGVPGTPQGQAYQATGALSSENAVPAGDPVAASINGTLEDSAEPPTKTEPAVDNYTLVMRDYVTYDIGADGTITLDGRAYPVPPQSPGFLGGFHVLAVDRRTLSVVSDMLYQTNNSTNPHEALLQQQHLAVDLDQLRTTYGESILLFLATVGSPFPAVESGGGPCTTDAATLVTTCIYHQTGHQQQFTVPGQGVDSLHVVATGAVSGSGGISSASAHGAVVTADLPIGDGQRVHPDTTLFIDVGGNGGNGGFYGGGGNGGWNGGGDGGQGGPITGGGGGGGGGGASDVSTLTQTGLSPLLVAAGGGGGGGGNPGGSEGPVPGGAGGAGGIYPAGDGSRGSGNGGGGGGGGTATAGGAGGAKGTDDKAGPGADGAPGTLGAGGAGGGYGSHAGGGGGGGGGYYGGGGGGKGDPGAGGGGGGGSSLVPAGGTVGTDHTGKAEITVSYSTLAGPTLAQALRPFGATPDVIDSLDVFPRYALVGGISPPAQLGLPSFDAPEASPLIENDGNGDQATGELQGALGRGNRQMWYGPLVSNAPVPFTNADGVQVSGRINMGMYDAIGQAHAPWPVPVPTHSDHYGEVLAYQDLSQAACHCDDIRSLYWNSSSTTSYLNAVTDAPYNPGNGYSEDQFDAVQQQLITELRDVSNVNGLESQMQGLIDDLKGGKDDELNNAYNTVKDSITVVNPDAEVFTIMSDILNTMAALTAADAEIGPVLGIAAAIVGDASGAATDRNGAYYDQLATKASDLESQAVTGFAQAEDNLDQTFNLIVSNWGKLQIVGSGLQGDHAADWAIKDPDKDAADMENGIELSYYRALVPVVYEAQEGPYLASPDPASWCQDIGSRYTRHVCPFSGYTETQAQYSYIVHDPGNNWAPAYDLTVVGKEPIVDTDYSGGAPIPQSLIDTLTKLGLYPAYLFTRWPLHRYVCAADDVTCSYPAAPTHRQAAP